MAVEHRAGLVGELERQRHGQGLARLDGAAQGDALEVVPGVGGGVCSRRVGKGGGVRRAGVRLQACIRLGCVVGRGKRRGSGDPHQRAVLGPAARVVRIGRREARVKRDILIPRVGDDEHRAQVVYEVDVGDRLVHAIDVRVAHVGVVGYLARVVGVVERIRDAGGRGEGRVVDAGAAPGPGPRVEAVGAQGLRGQRRQRERQRGADCDERTEDVRAPVGAVHVFLRVSCG